MKELFEMMKYDWEKRKVFFFLKLIFMIAIVVISEGIGDFVVSWHIADDLLMFLVTGLVVAGLAPFLKKF